MLLDLGEVLPENVKSLASLNHTLLTGAIAGAGGCKCYFF